MKSIDQKSWTMQLLFYTRLILYILAFLLPVLHPSIAVPYDRMGLWMWFVLVPGEMLISYYLAPPRCRAATWVLAGGGLLLFSIIVFTIFSTYTLMFIAVGCAAFITTALIFKTGGRGYPVAVFEPFFLGFLYYKILSFSRASESIARESWGITRLILILIGCAFLIHGMVLYFAAHTSSKPGARLKEAWLFPILLLPPLLLFVLVLPPDFVSNAVVFNLLKPPPKPKPFPLDEWGNGLEWGNLLSDDQFDDAQLRGVPPGGLFRDGDRYGNRESPGEEGGMLEGVPAEEWYGQRMGEGGENRQYAVMVVASSRQPVYAAYAYFDHLDPERGFLLGEDEPLNDLAYLRLLETWQERAIPPDMERHPQPIYYISTLPERVLAYRPFKIEPSVMNKKFHPFDFSYNTISLVSISDWRDWMATVDLGEGERNFLKDYLDVPLSGQVRETFKSYLESALKERTGYFEKVLAIFNSFSSFHYEMGFDDDVSIAKMASFLSEKRRGDCTEFSNAAAILARMAGVPSRVVTGYLASKNLQTFAHRRAVRMLQEVIEPLKEFPIQDLYLVTTAHHHSWTQLYMPGYGWIDFDPTSFAIPPFGLGNPNAMNVVIPLIRIEELKPVFKFPWLFMLQGLLIIFTALFTGLYLYRYGREWRLGRLSEGRSPRALRALYTLMLMKLAANGYDVKSPSETPLEYSGRYPELLKFASTYNTLRYRERYGQGEKAKFLDEIRSAYRDVSDRCRRSGLPNMVRRVFSLRGLHYRW